VAQLRLALAQHDPVVGDLDGNAAQILELSRQAADRGAHLVAFPEMALTGYPVEDLALRASFVDASKQRLLSLAEELAAAGLGELAVVVGYLDGAPDVVPVLGTPKGAPQDAAAVIHRGRVVARYAKHHLPNYGVFDEYRYFVPGSSLTVARVHGIDVAVVVCEDIWQEGGPVDVAREAAAGLLVVINGSPYERNKDDVRLDLVRRRAAAAGCTLAYVNMVGGQDELVFDGDSLVVAADGECLARGGQFTDELLVVDLDLPQATADVTDEPSGVTTSAGGGTMMIERVVLSEDVLPSWEAAPAPMAERLSDDAEVYAALVTGLRDYVRKNGFRTVLLGLSGGIDSSLVAAIACDAIGAENVYGVSNPSDYSSEGSKTDAAELARRTGLNFTTIPIAAMVDAFQGALGLDGLAQENLQARIRAVIWMGLSNQNGHLVLACGNKSELSVGYSTIYGDAVGGFAPIKDVPKTSVWNLARWRNAEAARRGDPPPIPESVISKPPSAELRPGQLDSDSLPDYALLDDVLDDYVEQDRGSTELLASGFDRDLVERVLQLTDRAEYKRRQYPPGPKISLKAFGRDRRLPITNQWREHAPQP
jgi:NAD+ synthase (glutamine-hydrolysing)